MKKYIINWARDDYGRYLIEAETLEQARELFESGEWKDEDLNVKGGGGMQVVDIEEVN